jgi:hypothetical protein
MFLLRSGLMVHVSPRSREMKKRFAATYTVLGLWGESRMGVFQLKRI